MMTESSGLSCDVPVSRGRGKAVMKRITALRTHPAPGQQTCGAIDQPKQGWFDIHLACLTKGEAGHPLFLPDVELDPVLLRVLRQQLQEHPAHPRLDDALRGEVGQVLNLRHRRDRVLLRGPHSLQQAPGSRVLNTRSMVNQAMNHA